MIRGMSMKVFNGKGREEMNQITSCNTMVKSLFYKMKALSMVRPSEGITYKA